MDLAYPEIVAIKTIKTEKIVVINDVESSVNNVSDSYVALNTLEMSFSIDNFPFDLGENDLIVFPGMGARDIKQQTSFWHGHRSTDISAVRIWTPGTNPMALTSQIIPEVFLHLNFRKIIIVDDVISSGATLRSIFRENYWRFPNTSWEAITWVTQALKHTQSSGVLGYKKIFASVLVKRNDDKKVPIVSLSTIINNSRIRNQYLSKYPNLRDLLSTVGVD